MSQKKYSSKRMKHLAGILSEQMFPMASPAPVGNPFGSKKLEPSRDIEQEIKLTNANEKVDEVETNWDDVSKSYLLEYIAHLRAMHLWFHSAHHVTKGTGFSGDHVDLYGKIYTEIQEEVDGAIEKAVGITNDSDLACPVTIAENAVAIMKEFGCPPGKSSDEVAEIGLLFVKAYIEFVEHLFKLFERQGRLTLGLNDQLAASANKHEEYVFLLQQRVNMPSRLPESVKRSKPVLSENWLANLKV